MQHCVSKSLWWCMAPSHSQTTARRELHTLMLSAAEPPQAGALAQAAVVSCSTHLGHGCQVPAWREARACAEHGCLSGRVYWVVAVEGRGRLKQLEDDHSKAVHIHLEVVRLMPGDVWGVSSSSSGRTSTPKE